jgi:DNA-binding NarL/FixJ family response regulator
MLEHRDIEAKVELASLSDAELDTQLIRPRGRPPGPSPVRPFGLDISPANLLIVCSYIQLGTQKDVAKKLGLSLRTVEAGMQAARKRLGLPTRVHVILFVDRHLQELKRQGVEVPY